MRLRATFSRSPIRQVGPSGPDRSCRARRKVYRLATSPVISGGRPPERRQTPGRGRGAGGLGRASKNEAPRGVHEGHWFDHEEEAVRSIVGNSVRRFLFARRSYPPNHPLNHDVHETTAYGPRICGVLACVVPAVVEAKPATATPGRSSSSWVGAGPRFTTVEGRPPTAPNRRRRRADGSARPAIAGGGCGCVLTTWAG